MKVVAIAGTAFMASLILCACASGRRAAPSIQTHWQPWTNQVTTAKQLASALTARWELEIIQAYCDATPSTPNTVQNLVALGEEWRGTLHEDRAYGFDRVWWYASTRNGKLDKYSVNAARGPKHWIIEIGNEQSLSKPPVLFRAAKTTDAR